MLMIDIDITIFFQFANFVVTLVALNFLLIRPLRDIVKKRRDLAAGLLSDTESFTAAAAKKLEQYEAALVKAREEAAAVRDAQKAEGTGTQENLLQAAQQEAQDYLVASRSRTSAAVAEASADLKKRVPDLAALVAAKLLDRKTRSAA